MKKSINVLRAASAVAVLFGAWQQLHAQDTIRCNETVVNSYRQPVFPNQVLTPSELSQFTDVSLSSYQLLTAAIKFTSEEELVKVVFMPFKLRRVVHSDPLLRSLKINIASKGGKVTLGAGLGFDNSGVFSTRGDRLWKQKYGPLICSLGSVAPGANADVFAKRKLAIDSIVIAYNEELLAWSRQVNFGVNYSFFEIVGGDELDANNDTVVDNAHLGQGVTFTGGITQNLTRCFTISAALNYGSKYGGPSGDFRKQVPALGWSVGVGARLITLNKPRKSFRSGYRAEKNYLDDFFIPGIVFGVSYENSKALGNEEYAKDGITGTTTFTPFVDFQITPKSQFRLGVPFKTTTTTNKDTMIATAFFQYTLLLADLTKL